MKGPAPQPTALKVLRGNPGRRQLNPNEPHPGPLDPAVPEEMTDPVACKEWRRVVPGMIETGQVTAVDRAALIGYCELWAEWRAATSATTRAAAFLNMRRTAAELGMTPAGRSRVHAVPVAPARGTWADVLK